MEVISFPKYRSSLQVEVCSEEMTIIFDQLCRRHLLRGKVYALLTPYLSNKNLNTEELVDSLSEYVSPPEVYYALLRLQDLGFLEEGKSSLPLATRTICDFLDLSYKDAQNQLINTPVAVEVFGKMSKNDFQTSLREMGVELKENGAFTIFITDSYRDPKLRKKVLEQTSPFLLIQPTNAEVWIGPLFIPGKGPCFDCLLDAINKNAFEEQFIEKETKAPFSLNVPFPKSMSSFAYSLAANEVMKWLLKGENQDLEGKVLSYHYLKPSIVSHCVIKRSDCHTCGSPLSVDPKPLELTSQKKVFTEDGGHRIKSPEETFRQYEHLISPITGVVDFLIHSREEELGMMNTYEAGHRMSSMQFDHALMHKSPRSHSAGKGRSEAQGKVSCLCEALERYSGIYQGNEPKKRAKLDTISKDAIHPLSLLQFSNKQYLSREIKNKEASPFHFIPELFDQTKEIDWTPVWSLTEKRFKYIPTGICYFNYPFSDHKFARGDSNGSAAGNTLEEAILQGFFELTERDQIALWWYSRLKRPELDLSTFSDPYIGKMISSYAAIGRKLWVIDLTFDLKIPTFAAISSNDEGGEILFGFGSHFDPNISALRALTEMNQGLLFLKQFQLKGKGEPKHKMIRDWIESERLENHPYLIPTSETKRKEDYIRFDSDDIKDDVLTCQKIVEEKGLEMLVLDQTRPDIGLPVVKVFVPGLRHFWNRFAPGRLYDVPFETGLVDEKLKEEDLNPIPFFL